VRVTVGAFCKSCHREYCWVMMTSYRRRSSG
jgi:hypothetical protein